MNRDLKTDWALVILLWFAGLFAAGQFAKLSLTLDLVTAAYPEAGARAALAVSIIGSVGIVFGATAGAIVARFGVRRVLLAALMLGAGVSALQALILPFPVLLASRVAEGFAHLAIVVAAPTLMARVSAARDVPVVMGLWGMFFGVGFALAGLALPLAGSLNAVFLAHSVGLALVAVMIAPRLPPGGGVTPADAAGWLQVHWRIYADARTVAPALAFLWHTLVFVALLSFLPARLDWPPAAVLLPLLSLCGTFAAGVLARRMSALRVAGLAFATTVVLASLLALLPEPQRLWAALPMMIAIGMVPGASFAAIPELNADQPGQARANGAVAQLGNVGTTFGPPLLALVLGRHGFGGLAAYTAALSLAGLLTVLWISGVLRRRG